LTRIGIPILQGDASTMVALLPLLGSSSRIFRSFFFILFTVLLLGVLHAVVLLPVLLGHFGPPRSAAISDQAGEPRDAAVPESTFEARMQAHARTFVPEGRSAGAGERQPSPSLQPDPTAPGATHNIRTEMLFMPSDPGAVKATTQESNLPLAVVSQARNPDL